MTSDFNWGYDGAQRHGFKLLANVMRVIGQVLDHESFILILIFLLSPVGPHLRLSAYASSSSTNLYASHCQYIGSRGIIEIVPQGGCSVLAFVDARDAL